MLRRRRGRAPTGTWAPQAEPVWWVAARVLDLIVRLLFKVTIVGAQHLPKEGPALLAANHVSYLDPVVLLVVVHRLGRKARFLVLRAVFDHPAVGWLFRSGRHIPVDAGARRFAAIRQAQAALAAGEVVLVYPEGTIGGIDRQLEAKAGLGLLALTSGAPVVPIGTCGLERPQVRSYRVQRRSAVVVIGAPVAGFPTLQAGDLRDVAPGRETYRRISEDVLRRVVTLAEAACALLGSRGAARAR